MKFLLLILLAWPLLVYSGHYLIVLDSIEFTSKDFDNINQNCFGNDHNNSGFYVMLKDPTHSISSTTIRTRGTSGFARRHSLRDAPVWVTQGENPILQLYIDPIYGAINPSAGTYALAALLNDKKNTALDTLDESIEEFKRSKPKFPPFIYRQSYLDCPYNLGHRCITFHPTGLKISYLALPLEKYKIKEGHGGVLQINVTNVGTKQETYTVKVRLPGHIFQEEKQLITLRPQESKLLAYYSEKCNIEKTAKISIKKDIAWRIDPTIFELERKWSNLFNSTTLGTDIRVDTEVFYVIPQ